MTYDRIDHEPVIIRLVEGDDYNRRNYGILYVSADLYRVTGPVHNPERGHQVVIWDNTGRRGPADQHGGKMSKFTDAWGMPTNDPRTASLRASIGAITQSGSSPSYAAENLWPGRCVQFIYPGSDPTPYGLFQVTNRRQADPVFTAVPVFGPGRGYPVL